MIVPWCVRECAHHFIGDTSDLTDGSDDSGKLPLVPPFPLFDLQGESCAAVEKTQRAGVVSLLDALAPTFNVSRIISQWRALPPPHWTRIHDAFSGRIQVMAQRANGAAAVTPLFDAVEDVREAVFAMEDVQDALSLRSSDALAIHDMRALPRAAWQSLHARFNQARLPSAATACVPSMFSAADIDEMIAKLDRNAKQRDEERCRRMAQRDDEFCRRLARQDELWLARHRDLPALSASIAVDTMD